MTPGNDTTAVSIDDIDQSDCNSAHRNNIPRHVEPIIIVCAVDDVLVHLNNQNYHLIHGTVR